MEQTRAINALQPYLALSKSATSSRAAADVITQATSAPNTYVFAELLAMPSVQNLKNASEDQYAAHYKLLEIFAWGTWHDYNANASDLPTLNPAQLHKLHLLTLLTLASTTASSSHLTYAYFQQSLGLSTPRELEKLVTDAIYNSLLTGTLNSKSQIVTVSSVAPLRDLAPGSVVAMVEELQDWSQRCDNVLTDLEAEIAKIKADAAERRKWELIREDQLEKAEKADKNAVGGAKGGKEGATNTRSAGGLGVSWKKDDDQDLMDVDDAPGGGKGDKRGGGGKFGLRNR